MTIRPLPKRSSNQAPPISIPGLETLFSDGSADFVQPLAPYRLGQEVTISIRGLLGVPVNHVDLRIFPDGEERLISMKEQNRAPFTYWSSRVALSRCPFPYRFRIQTDRQILWLNASGLHYHIPPDEEDFKLVPGFDAPSWPTYSTFYQIFPDRFFCGNPAQAQAPRGNSPSLAQARLKKWHEPLTRPPQGNDFYGGDLQGIQQKLDYLEELGINALFLTPIFVSPSNHRYDVADYRQVDPFLGGNEALTALSKALKKRKWKLILDGVFNHAGYHHSWFQDALKNPESRYRSCFTFRKDDSYISWLNHSSLPKWDFSSEMVRKELFSGPDAVAKFWLRPPFEIDGWRLDAPNMLGCDGTDTGNIDLWREFRREVKSVNPNAFLFGECFFEGTKWLQGDAFDSVMNYKGFTIPMIQWITGGDLHLRPGEISGRIAVHWLTQMMARIPFEIRNLQFNPLSTHDIPRFIHRVDGNEKLFRLAAVLQMAFPGVPSVYYGEELALDGGTDPDNRRPFPWDSVSEHQDLIGFLAKMARLRTSLRVLQSGAFAFLAGEEDALAYARFLGKDFLIVAANRAGLPRQLRIPTGILGLADGQTLRSLLSMDSLKIVQGDYLQLSLGPREAVWLGPA